MLTPLLAISLALLASQPHPQPQPANPAHPEPAPEPELVELLPGIKLAAGIVQFEGEIAVNAHHPDTPDVYLEMLVTAPDSREHEALVVARIKPSNLHAALLAAGFESGAPISRDKDGKPVPAHGDALRVLVSPLDDEHHPEKFIPITDWVMRVDDESALIDSQRWTGLVFAGSLLTSKGYAADRAGTLISLTSFGDEVIAPTWTVSDKADIDEPVWIANRDLLPKKGTPVVVRIEGVEHQVEPQTDESPPDQSSHEPDGIDIDRDP